MKSQHSHVAPNEVRGMKPLPAFVYIARHNNNCVRITVAKKLLAKAGVMKLTKNSYNVLVTVIKRSEAFDHVAPGEFELRTKSDSAILPMRKALA